jgi:signal transduction histidine kinase/tetratricopeptide (TPR) repeat protein
MNPRIQALEKQVTVAGSQREKIDALNALAWELIKPDPDRAIKLSAEAGQLAQSGGFNIEHYNEGIAASLCNVAHIYLYQSEYDKTLTTSFEIVSLLENFPPSITLSRTHNSIAASYRILGNMSEALNHYFKQIQISEKLGDKQTYANGLVGIGSIYHDTGRHENALEYFRESRALFEESGDTYWEALVLNNISYMHHCLGNYEHALARAEESVEKARHYGHKRIEILAYGTIGEIYDHMGQDEQALHHFQSTVSLAREIEYRDQEVDGLRLIAKFYISRNRPDEAIEALNQCLPLAESLNHRHFIYQCHELLYQAYKMMGDMAAALTHHEQFVAIRESVFNEESNQKLHNLEVLNHTETAKKEAEYYSSLYEIEQARRNLAEILNQIGRSLTSTLNLQEILSTILALLKEMVVYDRGAVLLLGKKGELEFVAANGFENTHSPLDYTIPIETEKQDDIFVQIYRTQEYLHLANVKAYAGWKKIGRIPTPGSWLGVPLIRNDEVIGMLSLARSEQVPFSQDAIILATALANQAAIAIENARLYNRTKAINDQLEFEISARTKAIRDAYDQLERLNQTKSEFITITAHELRTPVTVLKGYGQLLQRNQKITADNHLTDLVAGIVSGANRLHEIVNTMLLMTRVDNQALEIFSESLDINQIICDLVDNYKDDLTERNLELIIDENITTLPLIEGDEEVLPVVFGNILNNAIKYTPDGGRIHIYGRHWDGNPPDPDFPTNAVEVVIKDTGIGIDPKSLELIFTKFYQTGEVAYHSSGRTKFKGGGPGLGLAIARGIIEAHRGRLWAESTGKDEAYCPGSSFHIVLPLHHTKIKKTSLPNQHEHLGDCQA